MSVLSRSEIRARLRLGIGRPGSLVVTPLLQRKKALDRDALDLRLGCYFLLPRLSQQPHFCPDSRSSASLQLSMHVPLGKYLVVPAHQTVLGATLEYIKLPDDICGEILTKSSVARTFVVVETAPWIHPLYRGCLTLEIANVSNSAVLLYPGRLIAQLVLMKVRAERPRRDILDGTYLGPVYPEAPVFRNPEDDLKAIGVDEGEIWVIPEPDLASKVHRRNDDP